MKNIPSQSQSLIIAKNINYIKINDEKSLKKKFKKRKLRINILLHIFQNLLIK